MANEITIAMRLAFAKGALADEMVQVAKTLDMTGVPYERRSFSVPTTAGGTALPLGNVTTPGLFMCKNTDPTNFVTILSAASGAVVAKLKAGEACLFRFGATAPALLADTAAVVVEFMLLQD